MTTADLRLGAYADVLSGETWQPMMTEAPAEGRQIDMLAPTETR